MPEAGCHWKAVEKLLDVMAMVCYGCANRLQRMIYQLTSQFAKNKEGSIITNTVH